MTLRTMKIVECRYHRSTNSTDASSKSNNLGILNIYSALCLNVWCEYRALFISSITPIRRVPKLLPVGTKVRVFEEFDSYHSKDEFVIQETYIWNYHSPSSSSYIRLVLPFMYEDAKLPKEKVMNWFNQQTSREKTEL